MMRARRLRSQHGTGSCSASAAASPPTRRLSSYAWRAPPSIRCASCKRPPARFVGEASFAALTGAPVLIDEFEHDPARGAFPAKSRPPISRSAICELVANADLYLIAPASANTLAKLAGGLADNLLTSCALAATCPVRRGPRDEQPHVRAPGHSGQHRFAARTGRARDRARQRPPGLARRARRRSPGRARAAARRVRGDPARLSVRMRMRRTIRARRTATPPGRGTGAGCACWSPPEARASRSTACASSATAPRGAWVSRSPRQLAAWRRGDARGRQRRARGAARRRRWQRWAPPQSCRRPASGSSPLAMCC